MVTVQMSPHQPMSYHPTIIHTVRTAIVCMGMVRRRFQCITTLIHHPHSLLIRMLLCRTTRFHLNLSISHRHNHSSRHCTIPLCLHQSHPPLWHYDHHRQMDQSVHRRLNSHHRLNHWIRLQPIQVNGPNFSLNFHRWSNRMMH